jgi:hypothetical protein
MSDAPDKTESLLCIGGPADGRRITALYGRVVIPTLETPPPGIGQICYARRSFPIEDRLFTVLVPDGQSLADTVAMLIDGYNGIAPFTASQNAPLRSSDSDH